ncbi:hypothetical protein U9M48_014630 [Paspalum notatum var. saurae]|uniref:Uncharacterized protein n=1 Tax=Paspalum notatum var. saurae TaxID=547442 RepID=A0AAQ3T1K1_PASNO
MSRSAAQTSTRSHGRFRRLGAAAADEGFIRGSSAPSAVSGHAYTQSLSISSAHAGVSPSMGSLPPNPGCSRTAPSIDTLSDCDAAIMATLWTKLPPALSPARKTRPRSPCRDSQGVLVARRQRVLWREAVVHGDDEQAGPRGQRVEEGLVGRRRRRLSDEAAAVEVDEHGQLLLVIGGRAREVEANEDAGVVVDNDVFGGDAGGGVKAGRHGLGAHQAVDAPVAVDAEVRSVDEYIRARIHGGRAGGGASNSWGL